MKRFAIIGLLTAALLGCASARAQHTLGFVVGYGMGSARFQPTQETRGVWGMYSAGLTWRHYGKQRFVGGFGADLEFLQQGFSFALNASQVEDKKDYKYYTRRVNSVVLPIVWQPHAYLFKHRVRLYLEAAATFSYNISSTYEDEVLRDAGRSDWRGDYPFKVERDNRWGYGLAGGAGIAILIRRFELNLRARYYFGYSDIVRNRNKYADNTTDGAENPFWATPLRSPMDNLNISIGLSYRFNKEGFDSWNTPRRKREKAGVEFSYDKKNR